MHAFPLCWGEKLHGFPTIKELKMHAFPALLAAGRVQMDPADAVFGCSESHGDPSTAALRASAQTTERAPSVYELVR